MVISGNRESNTVVRCGRRNSPVRFLTMISPSPTHRAEAGRRPTNDEGRTTAAENLGPRR